MTTGDHLVVVRGGGDLATGSVARLYRSGFSVVVLELPAPLTVRRTVAVSSAITDGGVTIEDLTAVPAETPEEAVRLAIEGKVIPVMASPSIPRLAQPPSIVVDARMAKRNIDTDKGQAAMVVALGPGFRAGVDCHAVVETKRGHHLGRVIWDGPAAGDTGTPGTLGGATAERVLRAPGDGAVRWTVQIAEVVEEGQILGTVGDGQVVAAIGGVVRGLLAPGMVVTAGLKLGDIDPRADPSACFEISDKSLAVGGGVLEAVMMHLVGRES